MRCKRRTPALCYAKGGSVEETLVEGVSRKGRGELLCRTERDEMVVTAGEPSLTGQFINVRLLELRGNTLWGVREGSSSR